MKNPLWHVQPEGADWHYPWMAAAWDFRIAGLVGYKVLVVAIPFNFVVRALLQARLWVWKHSRFGPPPYEMTLEREFEQKIRAAAVNNHALDLYVSDFAAHRILPGHRPPRSLDILSSDQRTIIESDILEADSIPGRRQR